MSLVTDPKAVIVSNGSSDSVGDAYSYSHDNDSSHSSVDDLVQRAFHGRYSAFERELESTSSLFHSRSVPYTWNTKRCSVDQRSPSTTSRRTAEEDAAYLEQLQRELKVLQIASREADLHPKKPRRAVDKETFARLMKPNASSAARRQEKYENRRQKEQELARKVARVSPVATKAGARLYAQAKGQQAARQEMQRQASEAMDKEFDATCSFVPTISSFARRLAETEDYRGIEDPLQEFKAQEEEKQRKRLERQAEVVRPCTFRPALSRGSQRIISARYLHRGRSRSGRGHRRHRSRSASQSRPRSPDRDLCAGERLYRDGGERLLRLQIRSRMRAQEMEAKRVGHPLRLTPKKIAAVTTRLEAWQRARDRRVSFLRELSDSVARRPPVSGVVKRGVGIHQPPGRSASASSVPSLVKSATVPTASEVSSSSAKWGTTGMPQKAPPGEEFPATPSTVTVSMLSSTNHGGSATPPWSGPQQVLYREMRRIRFGALFYKYTAAAADSDVIRLTHVKDMVRRIYPEDSGIVVALTEAFGTDEVQISKDAFVDALRMYEATHGPQRWGRTDKDKYLFPEPLPSAPSLSSERAVVAQTLLRRITTPGAEAAASGASGSEIVVRSGSGPHPSTSRKAATAEKGPPSVAQIPMRSSAEEMVPNFVRHRDRVRASNAKRLGGAASRSSSADLAMKECTFKPQLHKRTVQLSNFNRDRRISYAMELQLRRRELEILHTLIAGEPSNVEEPPVSSITPKDCRGTSAQTIASQVLGLSPSVELSSLSGSSRPMEREASPELEVTPGSSCKAAAKELAALLDGASCRRFSPAVCAAPRLKVEKEGPVPQKLPTEAFTAQPLDETERMFSDMYKRATTVRM